MKKRLLILTTILAMASLSVVACGNNKTNDTETLELAVPSTDITDQSLEQLNWIPLGELDTHPELRQAVEEQFGIEFDTEANQKVGIVYFGNNGINDPNNTYFIALRNKEFTRYMLEGEDDNYYTLILAGISSEHFADVDAEDTDAVYAVMNAYFELLPDDSESTGEFNGDNNLSRGEAMTLVMRATTPVNESGYPETDEAFTSAVGYTVYTDFAAPMNEYAYMNTDNGLAEAQFAGTMTRGEYIYMVTKYIESQLTELDLQDYYAVTGIDSNNLTELTVISDGGDITLAEAVSNPESVPHDMYETLAKAVSYHLISEDDIENWEEPITKKDAIKTFSTMSTKYYEVFNKTISGTSASTIDRTSYDRHTVEGAANYYHDLVAKYDDPNNGCSEAEARMLEDADLELLCADGYNGGDEFMEYAHSIGADSCSGHWVIYKQGKAAGSEHTYAIYMRPGDPMDGERREFGQYINGHILYGSDEEHEELHYQEVNQHAIEHGATVYTTEEGRTVIKFD